ncbi:MAG: sulfite exporter TauE/SafE family protein, partial [Acidimicrobiia bacterium]|nr:sulfite exporter TauE/SafE family protein [Acidimicrobiia bacterium]
VGIALGTVVLSAVDVEGLERVIGLVMILFVLSYGWMRRPQFSSDAAARYGGAAGVASGFTSALAHLGGPPVIVYLMAKKVTPVTLVASTAVFFAVVNALKVPGYVVAGIFDVGLIASTLWAWAFIPVGVLVGRRMVDRINREVFEKALLGLLVVGAVVLLVR